MKFPSELVTKYNKPHFFLFPPMVRFFRRLSRGLGRFLFTVQYSIYILTLRSFAFLTKWETLLWKEKKRNCFLQCADNYAIWYQTTISHNNPEKQTFWKKKKKDFSSSCFIKPGITFSFSTERPTFEKQNTIIENCLVQFAGNKGI